MQCLGADPPPTVSHIGVSLSVVLTSSTLEKHLTITRFPLEPIHSIPSEDFFSFFDYIPFGRYFPLIMSEQTLSKRSQQNLPAGASFEKLIQVIASFFYLIWSLSESEMV